MYAAAAAAAGAELHVDKTASVVQFWLRYFDILTSFGSEWGENHLQ